MSELVVPDAADPPKGNVVKLPVRRRRRRDVGSRNKIRTSSDLWRRPIDLTPELAGRLLYGLAENHRHRLEVFVRQGERVSFHALLAVTGDSDIRVLSYFQGAVSRKLRRLLADREKKIHLIGWDYAATEWNADHTMIVDGICYVTPETRAALAEHLGAATSGA